MKLKILILEDDAIVAEDIRHYLAELGHCPLGPAFTVNDAIKICDGDRPEMALLDINLSGSKDGIDFARWLSANLPIPVIFLTAYADIFTLEKAKEVHPEHYLIKPFNKQQLKIAIELAGYNYYHPNSEQQRNLRFFRFNQQLAEPLSERELDVLKCLDDGFNNRQIAEKLFVSENTVKTHLKNIFMKTDAQSRTELISKIHQV